MLECDERDAQAHLAALQALVQSAAGTICVTEVTSTCLAMLINVPAAAIPRLIAALKLGGATLVPETPAEGGPLAVVVAFPPLPHARAIGPKS